MSGAADPMMLFPAGTTFTPYSVLRNVSDAPISVTPTLWWMAGAVPHSAQLAPVSLQPHQTQSLDVTSLLTQAGLASATKPFNGSFNLVFDANIKPDALLLAAGSVDQTNTYVFEVVARGIAEGGSKSLQYWSIGNGDDTMVTLWNPADEAQDFVVTLFFALPDGSPGRYLWPVHLEPRATRLFNVSEIVQNQIPDTAGNTIPAGVHEGGMEIAGSQAENQHILLAVDSGTYNVRKATCFPTCIQCTGYTQAAVLSNPFAAAVSGTNQLALMGTWGTGGQYNLTSSSTWSSNNTPVATVGATTGLVTGVSVGSPTISAASNLQPINVYICGLSPVCPLGIFGGPSPGQVVQVQVTGADIENNDVDVTLSGSSGVTGTLTIIVNGSPNNKPSFLASAGAALGAGQYQVPMNRPGLLSADTYTSVTADWDVGGGIFPNTFNLSRKWIVRGTIRHSQYNTVYESTCATPTQTAYLYTGSGGSCSWQTVTLRSKYVSQNEINGTGVSQLYNVLKYDDGRCASSYPTGANKNNSLLKVSSVTGQCNTTLTGGDSVATNPGPFYSNPYGCGDNLELVNSSNQNVYLKHVADQCANTTLGCADGHMDDYSSAQGCTGKDVGDLPGSPYWTVDDQ